MELLVVKQGWYGERIERHVRELASDWHVLSASLRRGLPRLLEDEDIERLVSALLSQLPGSALRPDVVLFLAEEPTACLLLPELTERLDPGGVICPVDDYRVVPRGFERQLSAELRELGVPHAFPRPFCSLSGGQGSIREFSRSFGRPEVEVALSGDEVAEVRVLRGAPCGSTHYMAARLVGARAEEAPRLAGLYVQIYPCLASHVEDPLLGEDMIHISAELAKRAVEKAIRRATSGG